MGLDIEYIAGKRSVDELLNLLSDQPHGERGGIVNDIESMVSKLKIKWGNLPPKKINNPNEVCLYCGELMDGACTCLASKNAIIIADFTKKVKKMVNEMSYSAPRENFRVDTMYKANDLTPTHTLNRNYYDE